MCSLWIRERAAFAEVRRRCHLRYLTSRANADTCEASDACNPAQFTIGTIFSIEQVLTMPVLQQWAMCCTCLHSYTPFLCSFLMKSNNSGEPTHCFVLAGLISGFCPTFFWDTLSLLRKTLYKHPAYLFLYCSLVTYLLSGPAPRGDSTIHRKLVILQASSSLDGVFEENQRNQDIFLNQRDCLCCSFPIPLHPLEEKKGSRVIYGQIKALNGPLFCDSAGSSLSVSFREMKLRKGQRASRHRESRRVFFFPAAWHCCC